MGKSLSARLENLFRKFKIQKRKRGKSIEENNIDNESSTESTSSNDNMNELRRSHANHDIFRIIDGDSSPVDPSNSHQNPSAVPDELKVNQEMIIQHLTMPDFPQLQSKQTQKFDMVVETVKNDRGMNLLKYDIKSLKSPTDGGSSSLSLNSEIDESQSTEYELVGDFFEDFKSTISEMKKVLNKIENKNPEPPPTKTEDIEIQTKEETTTKPPQYNKCVVYRIGDYDKRSKKQPSKDKTEDNERKTMGAVHFGSIEDFPALLNDHENREKLRAQQKTAKQDVVTLNIPLKDLIDKIGQKADDTKAKAVDMGVQVETTSPLKNFLRRMENDGSYLDEKTYKSLSLLKQKQAIDYETSNKEGFFLNLPTNVNREVRERLSKLFEESEHHRKRQINSELLYLVSNNSFHDSNSSDPVDANAKPSPLEATLNQLSDHTKNHRNCTLDKTFREMLTEIISHQISQLNEQTAKQLQRIEHELKKITRNGKGRSRNHEAIQEQEESNSTRNVAVEVKTRRKSKNGKLESKNEVRDMDNRHRCPEMGDDECCPCNPKRVASTYAISTERTKDQYNVFYQEELTPRGRKLKKMDRDYTKIQMVERRKITTSSDRTTIQLCQQSTKIKRRDEVEGENETKSWKLNRLLNFDNWNFTYDSIANFCMFRNVFANI